MTIRRRVYIAAPYTSGDVAINVFNAIEAAAYLFQKGHWPYVPHLTHFWHMMFPEFPEPYECWMALDLIWLEQCNALVRLHGESVGADREVQRARGTENSGVSLGERVCLGARGPFA